MVTGLFVPLHFRSRERNDHRENFRQRHYWGSNNVTGYLLTGEGASPPTQTPPPFPQTPPPCAQYSRCRRIKFRAPHVGGIYEVNQKQHISILNTESAELQRQMNANFKNLIEKTH